VVLNVDVGTLCPFPLTDPFVFVWTSMKEFLSCSRMLKKSDSGVLASLSGSTYRSVRLAASLAAALPVGHFEHPAVLTPCELFDKVPVARHAKNKLFRSLLKHTISFRRQLRYRHERPEVAPDCRWPFSQ
jgi:hypothetical protein